MDLLSMLMNAKIRNMDGDEIGDVIGIHIGGGKLVVTVDDEIELDEEDGDDPDGGEEIEDEDELDNTEEVPKPVPLRAVAGGKK
jgi:hypothetical protein